MGDSNNSALMDALNNRMSRVIVINPDPSPSPSASAPVDGEEKLGPTGEDELERREKVRGRIQIGERAVKDFNEGSLQKKPPEERQMMEDDAKRLGDQLKVTKPNRLYKRGAVESF